MARHRMAPADAAWLHMDRAVNRLIVTSVMWFDDPLDWDAVGTLLEKRLLARYPRFSQRVVDTPCGTWWEDVADFDLTAHVYRTALPSPGGMAELQAYASGIAGLPLSSGEPLWEAHFLDNFRGSGSAVVTRMHHCIADGIALTRVLLSLTDDPQTLAGPRLPDPVEPRSGQLIEQAREVLAAGRAVTRLFGLPPDTKTCLRGELGSSKTLAWSDPFELAHIRDAAHTADVTVNDVALCAISGALRGHFAQADGHAPDVRVVVPVNLRPLDELLGKDLGNDFGLLFLQLPTSIDDPGERLSEVHRRTAALKTSAEPVVSYRILELTGYLPYQVQQIFVEVFTAKASGVVTNVPGPRTPVFLAGRRLRGMIAWPPESGTLGLGISIVSYDGQLVIGLLTDDRLIRNPQRLLGDVTRELAQLTAQLSEGLPTMRRGLRVTTTGS